MGNNVYVEMQWERVNAFFIMSDLSKKVLKKIKCINAYPSKIRESRENEINKHFPDANMKL